MMLHEGEVPVDSDLARDLLRRQQPHLADLPITPVGGGTDNTMYRVGADHVARFPRTPEKVGPLEKELAWLPRLAPHLPCLIPAPTYRGRPDPGYPFRWALFTWIEGEEVAAASVTDWTRYGGDLADVVRSLHATDLMGETRSGDLCWYRGGNLLPDQHWTGPCFDAARRHHPRVDFDVLEQVWRQALDLPPNGEPHVWLHADLKPTNVLVKDGRLHAVIDFGALSIGLPDAEHAVVWDLPEAAREAYRAELDVDDLTWARARAWALALAVNAIAEYWATFPALATEGLNRLHAIVRDANESHDS